MIRATMLLATATLITAPLAAEAVQDRNRFAHDAIEAGQYEEAEDALKAELALNPDLPEAMLNLAAIYVRTGRADAAQALYARVLAAEDVSMLLTPATAMNSHAIALRGLQRVEVARMAAR